VKEATGALDRVTLLRRHAPDGFSILSGDDPTAASFVLAGGDGVISVTSNFAPREFSSLIHSALEGALNEVRELQERLLPLIEAMFIESNPIPLKAALASRGLGEARYRLPLVPMTEANHAILLETLNAGGWL
ncbi:MAG: dihydrodipicolinate synthase family protein, partial [Myxococcota bacterium]